MGERIKPIELIQAIRPIERPTGTAGISAPSSAAKPAPSPPPEVPGTRGWYDTPQTPIVGPVRHERLPSSNRDFAGKNGIYRMDVDLYEGRISFLSRHGPPLRGYVSTDLDEGAYTLKIDSANKQWVILDTVKPGLRFSVDLDGPDPFSLTYEQPLVLTAHAGFRSSGNVDSIANIISILEELSNGGRWIFLSSLSDILLEDVLDQLWSGETTGQGLIMNLLTGFEDAVRLTDNPGDIARVLRAIEGFTTKPSDLYIDAFTSYMLDPASREEDPERTRAGLSTVQIRFVFDKWPPERSVVIYADDISAGNRPDPSEPTYGAANLRYPQWLNAATTPRMVAAKKATLDRLENENIVSIIEQAHGAFEEIQAAWTIYGFAEPLIAGLNMKAAPDKWAGSVGAARAAGAPWRWKGIQPAAKGPGTWVGDFEGATNMSTRSTWYQLDAAGTPPGWGYRCGGLQFENFLNGMLIDAKDWAYWGNVGRSMRGLSDPVIAMSKVRQAEAQLRVAQRASVGLEWRCSSAELIPTIRSGLDAHGLSGIRLVHVPYRAPPPGWTPKIPTRIFR
jgi:hypothetical protein